jgi:hypothetical protein
VILSLGVCAYPIGERQGEMVTLTLSFSPDLLPIWDGGRGPERLGEMFVDRYSYIRAEFGSLSLSI